MHPLRLLAWLFGLIAASALSAVAAEVYPARAEGYATTLNGDWSFKFIGSADAGSDSDFTAPDFDVAAWPMIRVPGNWEMQGHGKPRYAVSNSYARDLTPTLGLYRRAFDVPAAWRADGRRVILRFEGVQNGFEAWVDGRSIGVSTASAYNPHAFDITDALNSGATAHTLAVRVASRPLGWEFDTNDDWALSGIMRDVTVFSVPALHLRDFATATKLATDGSARFTVSASASAPDGKLTATLIAPDGRPVATLPLAPSAEFQISAPQLWTAETPHLYRLRLDLSDASGRALQSVEERVGLREITIADGVLLLNGRPIKLRGVNHHDLEPATGRAVTEEGMRRDIALMKAANMNYVRTSHYAPHPRFIELCDELGLYVMCEVSIGRGDDHHDDPAYRDTLLARTTATIARDRNRPSVLVWSIGNENHVSKTVDGEAAALAKRLDPTRPICIPKVGVYFSENYKRIPAHVDIFAPHYPSNADIADYARKLDRPVIFTEYAHANALRLDRLQDQWEIIQSTPRFAGGSVWHFHDQGILRKAERPVDVRKPTDHVWLDARTYLDTQAEYGSDGLVYADRTPQPDYWLARKVYAPVHIPVTPLSVHLGAQSLSIPVENRHDFRSLAGFTLAWRVMRNGSPLADGRAPLSAASHASETVAIPFTLPADTSTGDVLALELRALAESGESLVEHSVRLDLPGENRAAWTRALPAAAPRVDESPQRINISVTGGSLSVDRATGSVSIHDAKGDLLVSDLRPHAGRRTTHFERWFVRDFKIWNTALLDAPQNVTVTLTRAADSAKIRIAARHPRPKSAETALVGFLELNVSADGVIHVSYDYTLEKASGHLLEAGLTLVAPAAADQFRWLGQGPWSGYPGMDRHNEFGLFHLDRADIRFDGNRRGVETALLTTADGRGVALVAPSPAEVGVSREGDQTLLRHNALLSGLGNKNWAPETFIDAAKTPRITGEFTLVCLSTNWPAPLTTWFGAPAAATETERPFHHSYVQ